MIFCKGWIIFLSYPLASSCYHVIHVPKTYLHVKAACLSQLLLHSLLDLKTLWLFSTFAVCCTRHLAFVHSRSNTRSLHACAHMFLLHILSIKLYNLYFVFVLYFAPNPSNTNNLHAASLYIFLMPELSVVFSNLCFLSATVSFIIYW